MKRHLLLAMVVLVLIISVISCELLLEKPGKPTIHALFVSLDYYDTGPEEPRWNNKRDARGSCGLL